MYVISPTLCLEN